MYSLLLVAVAAALLGDDDTRDVVKLKAGGQMKGRVVFENDEKVVLRASTRERTLAKPEVLAVSSVARSMEEWLENRRTLADGDVAGHLDLAAFCKERKLDAEEKIEAYVVLRTDPTNEKAHRILGHRRSGKTWFVEVDNDEVAWSLIDKSSEDWGKALIVESEHYTVRSDAGVVAAVDLLLDLESYYSTFFSVFGDDLELREILEPMTVYAYKNREEFPGAGGDNGGLRPGLEPGHPGRPWRESDPGRPGRPSARARLAQIHPLDGRIGQVYYDRVPGRPIRLFNEATYLLLRAMFQREQSGAVPPWIEEGFGEFFDAAMAGPPGKPGFAFDAVDPKRFAQLVASDKVAHLTRILNDQPSDFTVTPNRITSNSDVTDSTTRITKSNEVYALVHFLLHAENGAYRKKLAVYLEDAFKSKASRGVFEKAMGKDVDVVEKEWRAYVAEKAK